ncbi:hypothetical protein HAX54_005997 [Datura stramonium]|uniref:TF-B3 domain-containing protein n=1 Tax=Datura stramonium TaxID=4076 RepID=A0ABS8RHT6_DATST|nr:hypothetical protein [Datura stramonium]
MENMNCLMMCVNGYTPCQYIPKHFAYANGLIANKKCGLIIKDEMQRSWNLRISSCKTQVYIGDGCRKFIVIIAERREIDMSRLLLMETPIWKFHVVTDAKLQFRGSFRYLPMAFAKSTGLMNDAVGEGGAVGETIPIGFLKYLKEYGNAYAMLRRASKKWPVKVNGRRLEEGWEEFIKDHDLQVGDILIFRHEGDMEFEVAIFDSSQCVREYQQGVHGREEEKACIVEESSMKLAFKEKPKPNIRTSGKAFSNVDAAYKDVYLSHSHFTCTIRPYSLSKYCLCIPKQFAQENRLYGRKCMITMRDEQRSWTLSVYTNGKNTYIGSGWHEFCTTNCLKEGDRLIFEIVSDGETPIFRFHDLRESPSLQAEVTRKYLDAERMSDKDVRLKTSDVTTPKSQVAASTCADANPHFISTIKPYTVRFPMLYLPMAFAKLNGLLNRRELILVDEKRRTWSVWLGRIDKNHFGIKRGWRQFIKANGVEVGDTYKFELTNNGTIPVVHFHCKYTGK